MVKNDYELANCDDPDRSEGTGVPPSAKGWRRRCLGCARWLWLLGMLLVVLVLLLLLAAWFVVLHVQRQLIYPADPLKLYMNKSNSYEGDMLYPSQGYLSDPVLWPQGEIPYIIDEAIGCPESAKCAVLNNALDEIANRTCVQPRLVAAGNVSLSVTFRPGHGCGSTVGFQNVENSSMVLQLDYGCFDKGILLHLLGHVIGLWHEHNRPNRDNYLQINMTNADVSQYGDSVLSEYEQATQFLGLNDTDLHAESIMMFGPDAFSNGGGATIAASQQLAANLTELYERSALSDYDVNRINTLYRQECSQRDTE